MSHADPIADMLTRVRNAVNVNREEVLVRASRVCEGIANVLKDQGYIQDYDRVSTGAYDMLRIQLRYGPLGETVIHEIKRCSKPSCRLYKSAKDIHPLLGGMGISIVSTSQGVMDDNKCRQLNIGGELLCTIC